MPDSRVYILGAGCSKDCGYPLGPEMKDDLERFGQSLDPATSPRLLKAVKDTVDLIIFETKTEGLRAHSIPISLASIRKVRLSPWLPEAVATSVVGIIRSIPGCAGLKVSRSSLVDNAGWRAVIN